MFVRSTDCTDDACLIVDVPEGEGRIRRIKPVNRGVSLICEIQCALRRDGYAGITRGIGQVRARKPRRCPASRYWKSAFAPASATWYSVPAASYCDCTVGSLSVKPPGEVVLSSRLAVVPAQLVMLGGGLGGGDVDVFQAVDGDVVYGDRLKLDP